VDSALSRIRQAHIMAQRAPANSIVPLTRATPKGDPDRALRVSSSPRLTHKVAASLLIALAVAPAPATARPQPRIDDVEHSLLFDPSYKVRVDAALVLGRLRQQRSVAPLITALKDPQPAVRASAVRALGFIPTAGSREAVTASLHDPAPIVRHMARFALRQLGPAADDATPLPPGEPGIRRRPVSKPSFDVKPVGDPDRQAGPALRSHMRDFLVDQLRPFGDVAFGEHPATYAIDGIIKTLSIDTDGPAVEVRCTVQLVVSRQPGGGVFMTTSGEATVMKPRRQWRPHLRASLELTALEAAVRGASEDLVARIGQR
jgi:hypothetical protein